MPSPVGHALAAFAAGHVVGGGSSQGAQSSTFWKRTMIYAAFGILPDTDLLLGAHSTYTHSIGAMVLVGLLVGAITRRMRVGFALMAAYGTHILLDWLGTDSTPPIGVMALWPFTNEFYQSTLHWFPAISRRYWLSNFWSLNLKALAVEIMTLGPIALVAYVSSRSSRRRT